ncbi:MAG: hypothetical protein QOH48_2361 [Actinomycetota bacterium]|nr:hypothetical protein [Actinomycetota bacterium]
MVKDVRSLVVEVKGEDADSYASAQMNFLMVIGQITSRMTEDFDDFAVAIPAVSFHLLPFSRPYSRNLVR